MSSMSQRCAILLVLLAVLTMVMPAVSVAASASDAELTMAEPEALGFSSERLARIVPAMLRYIDGGKIPGTVTLVARRGEVVHFEAAGLRHVPQKLPMEKDTIVRLFSQSKPVTGAAVLILLEEGHFLLSDPISKYLPEFEEMQVFVGMEEGKMQTEPAERPITIHHLLTHTSGLTYSFFPTDVGKAYQAAGVGGSNGDARFTNLEDWSKALAELPLVAQPGTEWNYSVAMDVLGRLIEVVSGKGFGEFLKERIFAPLGMKDTSFWVPEEKVDRFAALYVPTPSGGMVQMEEPSRSPYLKPSGLEMGGSGLVGTAADYLRFAQMLVNGGELDGVRILAPQTVEMMMSNHLPESFGENPLASLWISGTGGRGVGFGLTGSVVLEVAKTGVPGSDGMFGWGGAATTHFFVDPEKEIVGIVLTQLLPDGTYPIRETMQLMTYQALVEP